MILRNIEIHGTQPGGWRYRLNSFRGDNVAAHETDRARLDLLRHARRAARGWRDVFPDDTIVVVEVELRT